MLINLISTKTLEDRFKITPRDPLVFYLQRGQYEHPSIVVPSSFSIRSTSSDPTSIFFEASSFAEIFISRSPLTRQFLVNYFGEQQSLREFLQRSGIQASRASAFFGRSEVRFSHLDFDPKIPIEIRSEKIFMGDMARLCLYAYLKYDKYLAETSDSRVLATAQ